MNQTLTARDLFRALETRLELQWASDSEPGGQAVLSDQDMSSRPALAGYLNLIHPNRVQVLGREELDYLDALGPQARTETLALIFNSNLFLLVLGEGLAPPADLLAAARAGGTPLLTSPRTSYELVSLLQYHMSRVLARRCTLHGVFMEIFTFGVLITGNAGSGKSELALELLNRGHRLIADDAPEFTQISPDVIDGACPPALQDCLEVRGLGVLNVREMFGDACIKQHKFLRLIVHLQVPEGSNIPAEVDRLHGNHDSLRILELDVPRITLPVLAGRNMAVITEAAVRDHMLRTKGYDATAAFLERHSRILRAQAERWEE